MSSSVITNIDDLVRATEHDLIILGVLRLRTIYIRNTSYVFLFLPQVHADLDHEMFLIKKRQECLSWHEVSLGAYR